MAVDTSLIKVENLLATGPSPTNTAVPTRVTKLPAQDIWEYEFPSTWPQTGIWTITLNSDGFSIPKGTVLDTFTVTQGLVYKLAVNFGVGSASDPALAGKVTALETRTTALENTRATVANLNTVQTTAQNNATQVQQLIARVDQLEIDVITLQNP